MASSQPNTKERAARQIMDSAPDQARLITEVYGLDPGINKLSPNDELWAWMWADDTVDALLLLSQGMPPIDVALKKFSLRRALIEQHGLTWDEQAAYAKRMADRAERALTENRLPAPPKELEAL